MISYVTEVDFKKKEVRTIFCKEVNTFFWDDRKFPVEEALKVSSEFFVNQLKDFLQKLIEHAERDQDAEVQAVIKKYSKKKRA